MSIDYASERAKWRDGLTGKPALTQAQYRKLIKAHYQTLRKYMCVLPYWFREWAAYCPRWVRWLVKMAIGDRLYHKLLAVGSLGENIGGIGLTIRDVLRLYDCWFWWWAWRKYILCKTHLSYEPSCAIDPVPRQWPRKIGLNPMTPKLAEMVHIILAEYVVLHNLMFASRLRPKEINTIDKWMRPI
jgi:hypothetical protein